jgi:hypothetical protein
MFIKWKIINKSDADYDSVHIGIWSDVDLGNANDDLPGCDTSLNLGYVYNGDDEDEGSAGYGTKPPACGFQLLQGPIVPGGSNDSALFDWQWRKGFRNLPLSSFTFGTGYGEYDPFEYGPYYYGRLIGMLPIIYYYSYHYYMHLAFVIDSASGKPIKFFLTGDPLKPPSPTNPLPENFPLGRIYPQDIRILLSTGPFALSKGDTQEVCAAFLIAQGNDRLNSITQLKSYSKLVAYFFSKIELEKRILGKPTEETPTVYYICQNYPNPFNSSTSIRFQIPEDNDVTLKVYDIIGREVAVLVREKKKAGIHSATWNATSFPSSVYIFQLRAGGFVQARTMMLIR